jgi:2-oxo-4-hydroxy-4-carboxy-5-ureidoimidazoline decarboxylase
MSEPPAALAWLDGAPEAAARAALLRCCASGRWVDGMLRRRPFGSVAALQAAAEAVWCDECGEADWLEAFAGHPRIGADVEALRRKYGDAARWSLGEQRGVEAAPEETLRALADENTRYFEKFGFIFIVCATGKSADEMLALLRARLPHERDGEIRVAAAEQAKITRIRLDKLLLEGPA